MYTIRSFEARSTYRRYEHIEQYIHGNGSSTFGCLLSQVSAAFRIEVLSEVPGMSQRAVERLSKKLDAVALTGESIEIGEEMRHLTLQV